MPRPILVSACLLGLQTRYDGRSKGDDRVLAYLTANDLLPIPVCPEQLGGQATPRPATHFTCGNGGDVLDGSGSVQNTAGTQMNESFILGASETLRIARLTGCSAALFKERSPSCGVHQIYLEDRIIAGEGVTSALLIREGLTIQSEEDL